jgi:hypothetical protein
VGAAKLATMDRSRTVIGRARRRFTRPLLWRKCGCESRLAAS